MVSTLRQILYQIYFSDIKLLSVQDTNLSCHFSMEAIVHNSWGEAQSTLEAITEASSVYVVGIFHNI